MEGGGCNCGIVLVALPVRQELDHRGNAFAGKQGRTSVDKPSESEQGRYGHSERRWQREALKSERSGPVYQARIKLEAAKEWIAVARHGRSFHCEDGEETVILSEAEAVFDDWIGRLRDIE
jgi:hypothetical protein